MNAHAELCSQWQPGSNGRPSSSFLPPPLPAQVTDDGDVYPWQRLEVGGGSTGGGWKPAAEQRRRDVQPSPWFRGSRKLTALEKVWVWVNYRLSSLQLRQG
ncbi:hypothetical protein ILYODFUR_002058 [Ilyodon furcidens]|uniref:Uncharacterized protein n=1 Tax=Ilyodon furcidens TaxID=33524 RepID=A0ABV0TH68_9TELE